MPVKGGQKRPCPAPESEDFKPPPAPKKSKRTRDEVTAVRRELNTLDPSDYQTLLDESKEITEMVSLPAFDSQLILLELL